MKTNEEISKSFKEKNKSLLLICPSCFKGVPYISLHPSTEQMLVYIS